MKIESIRTTLIIKEDNLFKILESHLKIIPEKSILAVTSKIISLGEGRIESPGKIDKPALIKKEADFYLTPNEGKKHFLTIKNNILIPSAGIDESNVDGGYVLWPKNLQRWANKIRRYLIERFRLKYVGVIITDSRTTPLRSGTSGVGIAHSGFLATNDYIGQPDLFSRPLRVTKANIIDGLAAAAVMVMGEGNEQTPLAIISDLPFVKFKKNNPSKKELASLAISLEDDLYAPLLKAVRWKKSRQDRQCSRRYRKRL